MTKRLYKGISVLAAVLLLLVSATALCGCKAIFFNLLKPKVGTLAEPEKLLREKWGIVLPSEAKINYNYALYSVLSYDYFLAIYYPDVPDEMKAYVGASVSEESKNKGIASMNNSLENILKGGDINLSDLDENVRPDWNSEIITDWKRIEDSALLNHKVYFPSTQRLLVWGFVD